MGEHERRKQFETIAVADRGGRMGRERATVGCFMRDDGIKSLQALQVGQVFRIIKKQNRIIKRTKGGYQISAGKDFKSALCIFVLAHSSCESL